MEVKVPKVGESVSEVTIGEWLLTEGQWVDVDQSIVSVESDKADMEIPAPVAGTLKQTLKAAGDDAEVGEVIAIIEPGDKPAGDSTPAPVKAKEAPAPEPKQAAAPAPAPEKATAPKAAGHVMPAAERALHDAGLSAKDVTGTGPGGRILKEDVATAAAGAKAKGPSPTPAAAVGERSTEVVRMSRMRQTIASRLVEAQQTSAILTTFNEVDMRAVMSARKLFQEQFVEKHGVKLGFMSFFIKACIEALKLYPGVNARIEGKEIVYHNYYDVGVAIGGGKGLVVPVIRNAERLSMAEIEIAIKEFAVRAKANKITLDELQGGTFSISNGGVYGSMLSTPILNPPQSGILGLHNITKRAVVIDDQIQIRPMMYVALSYDHRIVDGREAVGFLVHLKACIEDPARMLMEI